MNATPHVPATPLLKVQDLRVAYGGIQAVKDVSLQVHAGELVCLIGSNGAGKTSTLKAITASLPHLGQVLYDGHSTRGRGPWDLVREGLVMVPEGRGVFTRMSIHENLLMGAYTRDDVQGIGADVEHMYALFPRLKERSSQLAGTLSGGEQQMLAMGRALMSRPRLLVLDEPSMGLSPVMVDRILEVIREVHQQGTTLLLVEQNASRALALADRAYVMESGQITLQGAAHDLLHDPAVRAAYLGEA
jgi:branched-chain amino acid transport system ATP-binding protein